MDTFVVDRDERLDRFLAEVLLGQSRARIAEHIAQGGVLVDGKQRKAGFRLKPGMEVQVSPIAERPVQPLEPVAVPLVVPFEDESLLVVDKPAGMSVHPSPTSHEPTLVHALLARSHSLSKAAGSFRPGIVHRLDKGTSGLLLVAKTDAVHRSLQRAIQEKQVQRVYRAIVRGVPSSETFTIKSYIGRNPSRRQKQAVVKQDASDARLAITHCTLIRRFESELFGLTASEIECQLETGRTHQIRVHLSSVGLPILGDPLYGVACASMQYQALHASRLTFRHPVTGALITLESTPPWSRS